MHNLNYLPTALQRVQPSSNRHNVYPLKDEIRMEVEW